MFHHSQQHQFGTLPDLTNPQVQEFLQQHPELAQQMLMAQQMQQQQMQQQQQQQAPYQHREPTPEELDAQIAHESALKRQAKEQELRQQAAAAWEREVAAMPPEKQQEERRAMEIRSHIDAAPYEKSAYKQILTIIGSNSGMQGHEIAFLHPSVSRTAANWVARFNAHPSTWAILFEVLQEETSPVFLFSAASGIYGKLLKSFEEDDHALTKEEQVAIMQQLVGLIKLGLDNPGRYGSGTTSKLTECLSTLALQVPEHGAELISTLFQTAVESKGLTPQGRVFIQVLYRVCEEIEEDEDETDTPMRAHLRSMKQPFQAFMRLYITAVVDLKRQASEHRDSLSSQQLSDLDVLGEECAMVLKCAYWRDLHTDMKEFVQLGLWKAMCDLFLMVCTPEDLHNDSECNLFQQLRESFEKCFIASDVQEARLRWPERDEACQQMLAMLLTVRAHYEAARIVSAAGGPPLADSEEFCGELANLTCRFARSEMPWLAADRGSPSANAPFLEFWQFIVRLNQHPYQRDCVEATHRVINELERVDIAQRPLLQDEFATQMLIGLFQSIRYPKLFKSWLPKLTMVVEDLRDDSESYHFSLTNREWTDFLQTRHLVGETLPGLVGALGSTAFLQLVGGWILSADATWQTIEAAIVLLNSAGEARFFDLILQSSELEDPAMQVVTPQQGQQMIATLVAVEQKLLRFKDKAANGECHPLLLASICAFITRFHFLYARTSSDYHGPRLEQQVTFLFASLLSTQMSPESKKPEDSDWQWYLNIETMAPQDGVNMAGHAFLRLCKHPNTRQMIVQNPPMIEQMMERIFKQAGVSEKLVPSMRLLWTEAFAVLIAGLVAREPVDTILSPKCESLQVAQALLVKLATPALEKSTQIFNEVANVKQQCLASKKKFNLTRDQWNQITTTITAQLVTLESITRALAWGHEDIMAKLQSLHDRILAAVQDRGARMARGEQVQPLQIPPSLSFQLFSVLHPLFDQCAAFFVHRKHRPDLTRQAQTTDPAQLKLWEDQQRANERWDSQRYTDNFDVQDWCVIIYDHCIGVLYPNELHACIQPVIHTVLKMYTFHPMPSVLRVFEKAVGKHDFGQTPDLVAFWVEAIQKIVNQSLNHFKSTNVKDTGDELVTAFYSLAFQLYVHCPTALLLNPGLPLVGILRHAETMLMDENGQWCQQTLHFLRHLVTVREPVDDRPEEKKKLYHTWKQHGYDVLYRLLVTTFLRAFRGRWRKKNPTSIGLKMREDRHGTALLNIFEQSLARWPRTTTRWYKTWKHQVMDKDAMAAMVGDSDQSSGLLTMMAVLNQLTEIVKHHRLLQRLAAEEDNNAEDADGEEAMDDEGQAEASETTHSNRQGGNTMGQPEEANGMDA